jgi:ElaB/YqjD/DUF883 family membrane-anchored ribosome-binding protein
LTQVKAAASAKRHRPTAFTEAYMPKSPAVDVRQDVETALEDVARLLRSAAESVSGESEAAVSKAVKEVTRAAQSVRKHGKATAKDVAARTAREVKEHPIASLAAAITAAAALVGVIIAARRNAD